MKKIETTIDARDLDEVRAALQTVGVEAVTGMEARDYRRQNGHIEFYRGASYRIESQEKTRIEILVEDASAESAIEVIRHIAARQADATIMITTIETV